MKPCHLLWAGNPSSFLSEQHFHLDSFSSHPHGQHQRLRSHGPSWFLQMLSRTLFHLGAHRAHGPKLTTFPSSVYRGINLRLRATAKEAQLSVKAWTRSIQAQHSFNCPHATSGAVSILREGSHHHAYFDEENKTLTREEGGDQQPYSLFS